MRDPWEYLKARWLWTQAKGLQGLGEVTALWLERKISYCPYYGSDGKGPDEETDRLIPLLALANRVGFVTDGSQPGELPEDGDPDGYRQRAAVNAFVDRGMLELVLETMATEIANGELFLLVHRPGLRWNWSTAVTASTYGDTEPGYTGFGARRTFLHVWWSYSGCRLRTRWAVARSYSITLIDPVWGRNSVLWPALERLIAKAT